jgi:hypothetical protein
MALRKTTTLQNGLTATDAYWRVENISIQDKTNVQFRLVGYSTVQDVQRPDGVTVSVADGKVDQMLMQFELDLTSSENIYEQAYTYAKTNAKFSNAEDV